MYVHTVVTDQEPFVGLGRPDIIGNHVSADQTSMIPTNFTIC